MHMRTYTYHAGCRVPFDFIPFHFISSHTEHVPHYTSTSTLSFSFSSLHSFSLFLVPSGSNPDPRFPNSVPDPEPRLTEVNESFSSCIIQYNITRDDKSWELVNEVRWEEVEVRRKSTERAEKFVSFLFFISKVKKNRETKKKTKCKVLCILVSSSCKWYNIMFLSLSCLVSS